MFCGCFGIACAFNQQLQWSGYLIGIAAVFDFLDGFAARLLNAKSPIGGQLDSLADMVTFGALPGIIIFQLITISCGEYYVEIGQRSLDHLFFQGIGFSIVAFSALRLAKFNIDESQSDSFVGMPTPSIAILVASLPLILNNLGFNMYNPLSSEMLASISKISHWSDLNIWLVEMLQNSYVLMALAIICSFMMVMPIRMLALKFKGFTWGANKNIYIFILIVVGIALFTAMPYAWNFRGLIVLDYLAIPLVIIIYPLYSIILNSLSLSKRN